MTRHSGAAVRKGFDSQQRAIERARQHGSECLRLRGTVNGLAVPAVEAWYLVHSATALETLGEFEFYITKLDERTGQPLGCGCPHVGVAEWCWHSAAAFLDHMARQERDDARLAALAVAQLTRGGPALMRALTTDDNAVEHFERSMPRSLDDMAEEWMPR